MPLGRLSCLVSRAIHTHARPERVSSISAGTSQEPGVGSRELALVASEPGVKLSELCLSQGFGVKISDFLHPRRGGDCGA